MSTMDRSKLCFAELRLASGARITILADHFIFFLSFKPVFFFRLKCDILVLILLLECYSGLIPVISLCGSGLAKCWEMSHLVVVLTFRHHCSNWRKQMHITLMVPSVRKVPDGIQRINSSCTFGGEDVHFIHQTTQWPEMLFCLVPVFSLSIVLRCQGASCWGHYT